MSCEKHQRLIHIILRRQLETFRREGQNRYFTSFREDTFNWKMCDVTCMPLERPPPGVDSRVYGLSKHSHTAVQSCCWLLEPASSLVPPSKLARSSSKSQTTFWIGMDLHPNERKFGKKCCTKSLYLMVKHGTSEWQIVINYFFHYMLQNNFQNYKWGCRNIIALCASMTDQV